MNVNELQKKGYQFAHVPRAKHLEDEYTHRDLFGTCRGKCTQVWTPWEKKRSIDICFYSILTGLLQCDCKQYVKETAAYTIQPGQEVRFLDLKARVSCSNSFEILGKETSA